MGGTISSTCATAPPPLAPVAGASGGGLVTAGAAPPATPAADAPATAAAANAATTTPAAPAQATLGATLTQLQGVITQLQSVIGALAGAAQQTQPAPATLATPVTSGGGTVTGGGAPAQSPMQSPVQSPVQAPPGKGAASGCPCGCGMGSVQRGTPGQGRRSRPSTSPGDDAKPETSNDVRKRIVKAARDEVKKGVKEDAGEDKDKKGNIVRYRKAVSQAGENPSAAEAWCADFASYVTKKGGAAVGKGGKGSDYVPELRSWAKGAGRWEERNGYKPKPGDLVIFDWNKDGTGDHVAVVEKVNGTKITTIGGNESDSLRRATRTSTSSEIMGYVKPAKD